MGKKDDAAGEEDPEGITFNRAKLDASGCWTLICKIHIGRVLSHALQVDEGAGR